MARLTASTALETRNRASAWGGQNTWRVLNTDFSDGAAFLACWSAWELDPRRPALLHYVAITPIAPDRDAVLKMLSCHEALSGQACDLRRQWFGLLPGFHRLQLSLGRVLLTLCIGPLQTMLREQRFVADTLDVCGATSSTPHAPWDRWSVKALARLCRRGTTLALGAGDGALLELLTQAGFAWEQAGTTGTQYLGTYDPQWPVTTSRDWWRAQPPAPTSCAVIGAGLAGATVAAVLARHGWQVKVLDTAPAPASGASGLPVGLLAPQGSRDDGARSRLSRAGVRMTLQWCRAMLDEGQDWGPSGTWQRRVEGIPLLPGLWPAAGRDWSREAVAPGACEATQSEHTQWHSGIWHTHAAWVKPGQLVRACLAVPGVRFVANATVCTAIRSQGQWVLLDASGHVLAEATHVVVAAAGGAERLMRELAAAAPPSPQGVHQLRRMQRVPGQVSWGLHAPGDAGRFPKYPVHGHGHFMAHVPTQGGPAWFAGATYEVDSASSADEASSHRDNWQRLALLLPEAAQTLAERFDTGNLQSWRGHRYTTIDRLPGAGPLQHGPSPSVWLSVGMGSRGLTYAPLCAELLAAELGADPFPVELRLARLVAAGRASLSHHL